MCCIPTPIASHGRTIDIILSVEYSSQPTSLVAMGVAQSINTYYNGTALRSFVCSAGMSRTDKERGAKNEVSFRWTCRVWMTLVGVRLCVCGWIVAVCNPLWSDKIIGFEKKFENKFVGTFERHAAYAIAILAIRCALIRARQGWRQTVRFIRSPQNARTKKLFFSSFILLLCLRVCF